MTLSQLTVADLKKIQKCLTRKESLLAQLAAIDRQLDQMEAGGTAKAAAPGRGRGRKAKPGKVVRRRRRGGQRPGALKEKVIAALKAAGKQGLHVKALAQQLGVKDNNLRVWFLTTGKKVTQVKKVKPATYRWVD